MAGDDEDSYDGEEPSVKLEQKENCEEVNGSSDTSEVSARLASKSAEVKTTTWYSLVFTSCTVFSRTTLSSPALAPGDARSLMYV